MFKNKETRYRHTMMFKGEPKIVGYFLLFLYTSIIGLVAFGIGWIISKSGDNKTVNIKVYAFDVAIMFAMASIPTIVAANYIYRDAQRNNLLIKISLGVTYREYIGSVTFINKYVIGLTTIGIFTSLGTEYHDWSSAFLFAFTIGALGYVAASLQLMLAVFMANVWTINIVLIVMLLAILLVVLKIHSNSDFWIEFFKPNKGVYAAIIISNLILLSGSMILYEVVIPKMNYINWFKEKPKSNGFQL